MRHRGTHRENEMDGMDIIGSIEKLAEPEPIWLAVNGFACADGKCGHCGKVLQKAYPIIILPQLCEGYCSVECAEADANE